MMFDTGAEGCFVGKNHLQALGIAPPRGAASGQNYGVGGAVDTWVMPLEIELGGIKRKLQVHIAEFTNDPLLGQTFFRDFQYQIDGAGGRIIFQKKPRGRADSGGASAKDPNAIPFRLVGREMEIQLEHRGQRAPVFFDTGASAILLPRQVAQKLGIDIPEGAQRVITSGIGGQVYAYRFEVDELRLGPIVRKDVLVTVPDSGDMALLGQDFLGSWRFTVDNQNNLIKFRY